jgi:hypothetical protein
MELDFESFAIEVNKTEIKKKEKKERKKRQTLCHKADEADDRQLNKITNK